jgi:retinol dehydrogenase-12
MASEKSTVLITGGTKGIGFATAQKLAAKGFRVVLTGRSKGACDTAVGAIRQSVKDAEVEGMTLDLTSLASVREFAQAYLKRDLPLHILINNAGIFQQQKKLELSKDGFELTFATNVFGAFLLTSLLAERLIQSAPARIVWLSTRLHMPKSGYGGEVNFDFDNLNGQKWYDDVVFYKNSKLAIAWLAYEFQRRLAGKNVTSNAVCPGFVPETAAEKQKGIRKFVMRYIVPLMPGTRTVGQASDNTIFVATDPTYATVGGRFIAELKEIASSEESYDQAKAKRFWQVAGELTGSGDATLPSVTAANEVRARPRQDVR